MFGKAVIRLFFISLGLSLAAGVVTYPGAANPTKFAEINSVYAAEEASSLLFLPLTYNGIDAGNPTIKDTIFGLEMRRISEQENLSAVTAANTAWA